MFLIKINGMPSQDTSPHAKVLLYFEMANFLVAFLTEIQKLVSKTPFSDKSRNDFCCFFITFASKLILR